MFSFSGEWSGSSHPWPGGCPALSGGLRGRGQREQGPACPPSLLSTSPLNLSCPPLLSTSHLNLPLSTSHQVLLVLYLSPLLLAWGLQLLILLLLPALQSSIYKGLSSLASTSLSFYQVHGPETHPIGLNQTELVSIHQYWPQSTTNGLNQSDLVLIHQTWSQSIRIGLIHGN